MGVSVTPILKECHRLRKLLRDLDAEIDLGPRVRAAQQHERDLAEQAHADAHATVANLKLKLREADVTLKQQIAQLAKFEKQLETAGKEYDAKKVEIQHQKERIAATEESMLTMMEDLDAKTASLPTADATWLAAQKQFDTDVQDGQERLDRLAAERTRAAGELAALELTLPTDAKSQYDRLVKRHGADALAGVTGKSCGHCRTTFTEQSKYDLQAGRFLCCSNCGRGLYLM